MFFEEVVVILTLSAAAFLLALFITPGLSRLLIKFKCWKKQARTVSVDGASTPIFNALHKGRETTVPRMAGVLIWGTTAILVIAVLLLSKFFPDTFESFNFVSRSQTWIPIFTLLAASLLGLVDAGESVFAIACW